MEDPLRVVDQFLAVVPLRNFEWPQELSYSVAEQQKLIQVTLHCPLCKNYPPPVSYQLQFLKHILTEAENRGHEVADEVYELYGALVARPGDGEEKFCFKSYNLGECGYITLKESTQLISGGTTGLSTWQAALHFVKWVAENREIFHRKRVIELGSGLGLAGIAVCRLCRPSAFCFTDCHGSVMERLRENIEINLTGCTDQRTEISLLDWRSGVEEFVSTHGEVDCIIATDVIYDLEITTAFVQVVVHFLRPSNFIRQPHELKLHFLWQPMKLEGLGTRLTYRTSVAYVTSTIRNEETYKHFCTELDKALVARRVMQDSNTQMFYFDRSQRIEILELKLT